MSAEGFAAMTRILRRTSATALLAALLALSSCQRSDRLPCFPASGRVLLNDKPVEGAEMWLFPTDPAVLERQPPVRPFAKTAADGSFDLMTYVAKDGAPAGTYKVRVICEKKGKAAGPADDERAAGLVNVLPAVYGDPEKSGLTVTIRPGENAIPAFALKK